MRHLPALVLGLLALGPTVGLGAQEASGFRAGVGLGVGLTGSPHDALGAALLDVGQRRGGRLFSARLSAVSELFGGTSTSELAALFGQVGGDSCDDQCGVGLLHAVSAGLGMVHDCEGRGRCRPWTPGLALGGSVGAVVGDNLSLSLDGLANLNGHRSFGALVVVLRIGKLR